MKLFKGVGDFFALDIGTNAVRVVQLSGDAAKGYVLTHYGYAPLDIKIHGGDSAEARRRLGEVIMTAIGQAGIRTRNVAISLPANKTFTTVIDVPKMTPAELKSTLKYEIDQYIPMAIDDAKVDWAVLGQSLHDPEKQEVLLSSTAVAYAEEQLEFIENLGLNVVAAEPAALAMVRALLSNDAKDARMMIDVGELATDLVVTFGDSPRLVRNIPTGLHSLVKTAAQNLNVQEDQARQFILKFGLAQDRLEGQVYHAIEGVLEGFTAELIKSVKFFQTRYSNTSVSGITLTGFAGVIPQFDQYIAAKTTLPTTAGNPWQSVKVAQALQTTLQPVAAEFAVAVGLAQRGEG